MIASLTSFDAQPVTGLATLTDDLASLSALNDNFASLQGFDFRPVASAGLMSDAPVVGVGTFP